MIKRVKILSLLLVIALLACLLTACSPSVNTETESSEPDTARYLVAIEDEPDTVDFQCTSIHYTIAQNVFNRLVEMEADENGEMAILPSLAEAWEISEDRRQYTFHLRKDVKFSNGAPLTASDVYYTFIRLLNHPDSCNQDIIEMIEGGKALTGFEILGDYEFVITLSQPFEAFLACLSMPGASILDEETTEKAGDRFGLDPEATVGTGSFILKSWEPGKGMLLTANPDCWAGAPKCAGLDLRFMNDSEQVRTMFDEGELDILNLDELGDTAEYYLHGNAYADRLQEVRQIGITYIALNETVEPLNDARVRKALQLGLDRQVLLDAIYSDRGTVENGIFPHGLYGFNPDLPAIPHDPEAAKKLLEEAGLADGFTFTISVNAASTQWELALLRLAASMWEEIGVTAEIEVLPEDEFMRLRKTGALACYAATWIADYNDPDNFIYTFFGSRENTTFRSLCYQNDEIIARVRDARAIGDPDRRVEEYRELEKIIIQDDAAGIPLFSRLRYYVTSERLQGFRASWNGSVKNNYRDMTVG